MIFSYSKIKPQLHIHGFGPGRATSMVSLRLMPAALRFTPMELRMLKNAHDAVTIRYGATTVQAGSATAASRSPTNVHDLADFL